MARGDEFFDEKQAIFPTVQARSRVARTSRCRVADFAGGDVGRLAAIRSNWSLGRRSRSASWKVIRPGPASWSAVRPGQIERLGGNVHGGDA